VRGCYYGFEEVGGFEGQGLEVEVPDEVFEDAKLFGEGGQSRAFLD
jgi:hypothetical protein